MSTTIDFYFDYISPFAYLAWHRIQTVAARSDVELVPKPVLFAALLNHHGTKGPAEVPAKRHYVFIDSLRKASLVDVPLRPPPSHPFNPLLALRVSALPMEEEVRRELITRLYASTWADEKGVSDKEIVSEISKDVGVPDAIERAQSDETKARVRMYTEEAIAAGVFGVPSMLCKGQLFWGFDSIEHLERLLDGLDPVSNANVAQWAGLPASAQRKR